MTEFGLDASQETRITVMQLKIERLEEKQEDLRERLKVVEKWVIGAAAVLAKAVKSTKTDVDDQLFEQVAKAIRNREVDKADDYIAE